MSPQRYCTLVILAAMLSVPASQADESNPPLQRSKKPVTAPAPTAARKPVPESKSQKTDSPKDSSSKTDSQTRLQADSSKLEQETAKDMLNDLRVKPAVADKIVKAVADPEQSSGAKDRIAEIAGAAADLDIVAVSPKVRDAVVDAVSRSDDPKGTANEKVGEAATDEVFGKEVTKLVPADKRAKFREVFAALASVRAALENLGAAPEEPEVVNAVKEGAQLGITTQQEARIVMEKAAQKVLDKQGFTPAKPGETLDDRLARMVEEQKKLQAELNAKKAADAAKAAAKVRAAAAAQQAAKARAGNVGEAAISQGAAGSTTAGRSVSAKVKVAVGGGASNTSGAGTAKQGTGTDATRNTGVGGANRADLASSRLAAGSGGTSSAGRPTSGAPAGTAPGASTGAPAAADSVPTSSPQADMRTEAATTTTQTPQADSTPVNNASAGSPTANSGGAAPSNANTNVATGEMLLNSPNNNSGPNVVHYDTGNPNVGVDITYNSDNTYSGVVTVVTKDAAGNIVSVTETPVSGTWGYDSAGEPKPATQTVGETTSAPTSGNGQSSNTSNNQQSANNDNSSNEEDDDDSDDDDKTEDPPPAEQTTTEQTETETTTEESKEASTTPNPLDIGGGDPTQLSTRTGGRLGNQDARRQQRGLDLARFGGAAGPQREGKGGTPTLLTPEEISNAEKALNMRRGAGVTNPNPLGKSSVVATDRDLKELHLRGNGGAKGPTDKAGPAKPQDPRSPVGGATPGIAPPGGTRINASRSKTAVVKRDLSSDRRIAQGALDAIFK
ncbi:MAG TPA: hypothetical protein VK950_03105 [Methylophilus sp.]|nr:hypothetical protein [Methylophilus sp.]